jgi:hypothetical protein
MSAVVLLTGIGHLGGPLLDRLACSRRVRRVVALSRDRCRGEARCNLARLKALATGHASVVEHRVADLHIVEEVGAAVREVGPDLVVHAASLQTWWLADLFPEAQREDLRRLGYGVWLPLHLCLALSLCRGLEQGGYRGPLLNAAYPDVVNVVLGRVGRPPSAGIGNIDELVAKVRLGVAASLSVAPCELDIWLVAHHALQRFAFAAGDPRGAETGGAVPDVGRGGDQGSREEGDEVVPPFYLRVEHRGRDVTEEGRGRDALLCPCPLPSGPAWGDFSAAAGALTIDALLATEPSRGHASGPRGLPGGYPVSLGSGSVALAPVPGLGHDEAVAVNERSHRFDGIDAIGEDGTVVFVAQAAAAMRDMLGYDCSRLPPAEVGERARELSARFGEHAARYGVDLPAARV